MAFPETSAPRESVCIVDLMVYTAICALPLAGLHPSFRAAGVSVILLVLASLLWWLAEVGGRVRWLDCLALPVFLTLALVYLFLILVVFCAEPAVALSVLGAQVSAMMYASFRW
jgi:hypothetical protein